MCIRDRPRIAFYTLGCKLNFSETATISRDFDSDRYDHVTFNTPAEVYVINTCSVTENADKKFKVLVKKALKQNLRRLLFGYFFLQRRDGDEKTHHL